MSYKKFTKNIGLLGLTQVIVAVSGIALLPVITKSLGAENYGVWTQIIVTLSLLTPFMLLGLPYTLVRFLAGQKDQHEIKDGIWSTITIVFGVSMMCFFLLILFTNPISRFLGCDKIFINILAITLVLECLDLVFLNVFRAFQQINEYCLFGITQNVGETGLVILAIWLGYGLFGAVMSLLLIRLINFVIMGAIILRRVGFTTPRFLRIKKYLSFGIPTILGDVSFWITQSSDKYLIGFFLGTIYVGYYAPAYTLGGVIAFFIAPLSLALPATLSKHYDENNIEGVKNYLKYSLKYFLALAIPSVFGISILSYQLLTIFSTTEIAQHSYYVVPFIALCMLFSGTNTIIEQIIGLKKKTHVSGAIWMIAAFSNLGLNFIFIPRFGILGAAITTLVAYIIASTLTWHYSFKRLSFEIDGKFILKSITASVIMSLFVVWLNPLGFYKTMISIALGALIYGALVILFRAFSKKEFEFAKNIFTREESTSL